MTKRGVLFLLIVVLLSSSVFAIGISPAKVHHDFQPGLSYTKEFRAWNTLTYPIDISLSVEGDLAEYMSLSEPYLKDLQPNESRVFYLSMNLPAQLESGGLKMSYVRATEEKRNDRGTISVRGAVRTRVEVKVAIEGKSVEITSLDTENVAQGAPSYFEGTAHNYGTEKINRMDGYAEVFDQEGKSLFNTKIKK